MPEMTPGHPNLEMNEYTRRSMMGENMKHLHADRLRRCVGLQPGAKLVAIKSCVPLWHPIIKWAFGRVTHVGDVFVSLRVLTDADFVQHGIPWDQIDEIAYFTIIPTVRTLKARKIGYCHGIPESMPTKWRQNSTPNH